MWLGSRITVAVAQARGCSSYSTPSLGTSICCGCSTEKGEKRKGLQSNDCFLYMYTTQIKVQSISFTSESLFSPFSVNVPRRKHHPDSCHHRLVLSVLKLSYKSNQNINALLCLPFFFLLNIMLGRVIQSQYWFNTSYPFPLDGIVDGFQFLVTVNKADMNVPRYVFWWPRELISFG